MKCACPACGRSTHIDPELGDFPTRCHQCSSLLRRPVKAKRNDLHPDRRFATDDPVPVTPAIKQGGLAGLLSKRQRPKAPIVPTISSPQPGSRKSVVPTIPSPAIAAETKRTAIESPAPAVDVEPAVAHLAARRKAVRLAQLRGNHQTLGALNTVGFMLVGILAVAAILLGAKSLWNSPSRARGASPEITRAPAAAAAAPEEPKRAGSDWPAQALSPHQ